VDVVVTVVDGDPADALWQGQSYFMSPT
jgi:hypothetical protein